MLLLIELALCFVAVVLALACPRLGNRWFTALERRLSRFAARRRLAVLTILLLALGARVALLPVQPIPIPVIHDEFSYLLLADTFAHGRLTNPTHPMWKHFETFHVIQQPTYTSMYHPAQSLFLGIGQAIMGHPFWGVWLSGGLMCAATCWALQGWMPPSWAFLGGILTIIRIGTFSYWVDSYWGGCVAAIGGALVLGAFPRVRRLRIGGAIALGSGLALLANSRPYEGFFYSLPILIGAAVILVPRAKPRAVERHRILLTLGCIMALTVAFMGYYCWRTTGNPFLSPYMVDRRMEHLVHFPWEKPELNPRYRFYEEKTYTEGFTFAPYRDSLSPTGFATLALEKLFRSWYFFLGPILTIPLVVVVRTLPYNLKFRDIGAKPRLLIITFLTSILAILLPMYFCEHYAAPITALTYALVLYAMRVLWAGNRSSLRRLTFVRYTVAACLLWLALQGSIKIKNRTLPVEQVASKASPTVLSREEILQTLSAQAGKHVVIVSYSPDHNYQNEWVYNRADIDASKVVWARDLGPQENSKLLAYFKGRKFWLVHADQVPATLLPYQIASSN